MGEPTSVPVPADTRVLCTLPTVDYQNAVLVELDAVGSRSAESWARAMLTGAPADLRERTRQGWARLGLRLGEPDADGTVLGWWIRESTPDSVRLGAESPRGLVGELVVQRRPGALLFAAFVQQLNPDARAVWAAVQDGHVAAMHRFLAAVAAP